MRWRDDNDNNDNDDVINLTVQKRVGKSEKNFQTNDNKNYTTWMLNGISVK